MTAITFDTLKFSRKLESGGVPRDQAVVIAEAEVQAENIGQLATKSDLEATKAELKSDLRELELRLTIKFGSAVVVAVGVILTAMRFMVGKGF